MMLDIEHMLKSHILKEFMSNNSGAPLNNDYPLVEEGVLDSLGIFSLIPFLEATFGIRVASDEVVIENFETIDALKAFVEAKLAPLSQEIS